MPRSIRWNFVVNRIASDNGWTTTQADTWLNDVWANMFGQAGVGDEIRGQIEGRRLLRLWLVANYTNVFTLPRALEQALA